MLSYPPLSDLPPTGSIINFDQNEVEKYMQELDLSPKLNITRDLHRDQDYEDKTTLIDQRYRLMTEINEIRKENEGLKRELIEKDKSLIMEEEAAIDLGEKVDTEKENAYQLRRVVRAQEKLSELTTLQNELNSQYNFLYTFFSSSKVDELRGHTGIQSNQSAIETKDLEDMESVLNKAVQRLNGPVADNRSIYNERQMTITKMKSKLKKLKKEEKAMTENAIESLEPDILPEELIAIRDDLKHKLDVLKHRKFNRMKEVRQRLQREAVHRYAAEELQIMEEKARNEENERVRFRTKMQKKHREENEELLKQQNQKEIEVVDDEEEKWRMITYVKEAHE